MKDRTLIAIKPDAVRRGLIGLILSRFEQRGFKVTALKMLVFTKNQAEKFYEPHFRKDFFRELVNFVTSGPTVVAVLEAPEAEEITRTMVGTTRPNEASPGTIRGDFALNVMENVIHASDSPDNFMREFGVVFSDQKCPV